MPTVSQAYVEKYRCFSLKLADPQVLEGLKHRFSGKPELPPLIEWLHRKLRWSKHKIKRYSGPLEILAYGKGRCREFSILFTALCLAHDIRARLILDLYDHVWTEVWSREEERWFTLTPLNEGWTTRTCMRETGIKSWKLCGRSKMGVL